MSGLSVLTIQIGLPPDFSTWLAEDMKRFLIVSAEKAIDARLAEFVENRA